MCFRGGLPEKLNMRTLRCPRAALSFSACSGVYLWQFCDIRVSDEWWGVRPRTMNNKGVFDEYRRPKLCHATVRQLFAQAAAGKNRRPKTLYKRTKNRYNREKEDGVKGGRVREQNTAYREFPVC